KVWAMLSPAERRAADRTKLRTDREGRQFASWPEPVGRAMTAAGETHEDPRSVGAARLRSYARRLGIETGGLEVYALARAIARAPADGAQAEPTKAALYARAKTLGISGRSRMTKAELARAIRRAQ
ncbi:MAG: Rho termination factor N-terminal domain-containing protein, partial [Myxococcales bacterium]